MQMLFAAAERQHQRKIARKDQEASGRTATLCTSDSLQYTTCFKNDDVSIAKEATVCDQSPFRGIHKLQQHLREVRATLSLSLSTSDTPSSSELEHSTSTFGVTEQSVRDLAQMDLELLLNLVRSEPRPTSEASPFPMHPSRQPRLQITAEKTRDSSKCSLLHTHT